MSLVPVITDHVSDPSTVISLLESHLPYSLPLLRRLQFMSLPGGRSGDSHVLASFGNDASRRKDGFTAALLDFSRGPETETWIYSSLENPDSADEFESQAEGQIIQLFQRVKSLEKVYCWGAGVEVKRETPGVVLVGTVHEKVLRILQEKKLVKNFTNPHFKFVFMQENLPAQRDLPDGMEWGVLRVEDLALVLSRTEIPRKVRTMKLLPSAAIRIPGTSDPIAWAFLGLDGSLKTLHCEEAYRGRGLAKAVALKLLHERSTMFSNDGYGHADVGTENLASQGVCKSLGGKAEWIDYWAWISLEGLPENGQRD